MADPAMPGGSAATAAIPNAANAATIMREAAPKVIAANDAMLSISKDLRDVWTQYTLSMRTLAKQKAGIPDLDDGSRPGLLIMLSEPFFIDHRASQVRIMRMSLA